MLCSEADFARNLQLAADCLGAILSPRLSHYAARPRSRGHDQGWQCEGNEIAYKACARELQR